MPRFIPSRIPIDGQGGLGGLGARVGARWAFAYPGLRLSALIGLSQLAILLCFGIVGGRILLFEARDYRAAEDGVAAAHLLDLTLKAASLISVERAPTNGAIGSEAPLARVPRDQLAAARSAVDTDLDAIRRQAVANKNPHSTEIVEAIDLTQSRLVAARRAVDELIEMPLAARTTEQITTRFAGLVAVLPSLSPGLNMIEATIVQADPSLTGLVTAARAATALRDLTGRVGAVFTASLMAQRTLTLDENTLFERLMGQATALDVQFRVGYRKFQSDPGIDRALAEADRSFFADGITLLNHMTAVGRSSGQYGLTPAEFARLYVPMTASLIRLRDAVATCILDRIEATLRQKRDALALNGSALALALAFVVGLSWILQARVCRPLRALTDVINRLADDDYSLDIPMVTARDELGDICNATRSLRDKAFRAATLEQEAELSRAAMARRRSNLDELARAYSQTSSTALLGLVEFAGHLLQSASEMAEAADLTRREVYKTASDAVQSSEHLSVVTASSQQLIASVTDISKRVEQVADAVQGAVEQVQATYVTVQLQSAAAARIRNIVDVIGRTASRSKLLALNATIEAARAGESGRGFAVVASEVKALADETAQATKHIGKQLEEIQHNAMTTEAAVRNALLTVEHVSEVASAIIQSISEQGSAIRDIGAQVEAVADATRRTTGAMQGVALAAEHSESISLSVQGGAQQMTVGTTGLRQNLHDFLDALQADYRLA